MSYEHPRARPRAARTRTRTLGMLAHLGGILAYFYAGWVPALVIWLVSREKRSAATEEARVALNFQLTVLIALIVCTIVKVDLGHRLRRLARLHRREHHQPRPQRPGGPSPCSAAAPTGTRSPSSWCADPSHGRGRHEARSAPPAWRRRRAGSDRTSSTAFCTNPPGGRGVVSLTDAKPTSARVRTAAPATAATRRRSHPGGPGPVRHHDAR